jgi:hypothetical protein
VQCVVRCSYPPEGRIKDSSQKRLGVLPINPPGFMICWVRLLQNAGILYRVDVDGGCSKAERCPPSENAGSQNLRVKQNVDLKGPDQVGCVRLILADRIG